MGRPTQQQLQTALERAAVMREHGEDDFYLAKALLNHHYQLGKLEAVLHAAKHYLHSGDGAKEHQLLIRAIEEAEKAQSMPGDEALGENDSVVL